MSLERQEITNYRNPRAGKSFERLDCAQHGGGGGGVEGGGGVLPLFFGICVLNRVLILSIFVLNKVIFLDDKQPAYMFYELIMYTLYFVLTRHN